MLRASPMSQVAKTRILWLMGWNSVSQAGCAAKERVPRNGLDRVEAGLRPAWTGRSPVPTQARFAATVRVFLGVGRRRLPAHDDGRRLREPRKLRLRKCWWRGRRRVRDCVPPGVHLVISDVPAHFL